jgi:adenine-specific DNA-methyltransferase
MKLIEKISLFEEKEENENYLSDQLITYLGNKRSLLGFIEQAVNIVKAELNQEKLVVVDLFSGSGIVSRYLKKHSSKLITNDIEPYCKTINTCYLSNSSDIDLSFVDDAINKINHEVDIKGYREGFIQKLYSPDNDNDIQLGERVFFTSRNAKYIDTVRQLIDNFDENIKPFLIAPLLSEASMKNNTSGVFKGFYKNTETGKGQFGGNNKDALKRITGEIKLKRPILSNFECEVQIYSEDSNTLAKKLRGLDLVYLDPPYNQHPYGSNYFMLNLINNYQEPKEVSRISGIPKNWNRSSYNKQKEAHLKMKELINSLDSKYILISFNSEGFITKEQMLEMLNKIGEVRLMETDYNTFRGSRNLKNRNKHVKEYLYLVRRA